MKKTVFKIFELILCIGLFIGVIGYYKLSTSAEFNPTAARDFNRNIVESKNNQKKETEDSSEGNLWKKDENSMDNEASSSDNTSDYTKNNEAEETPQENSTQQTIVSATTESGENNSQSTEATTEDDKKTADTVYDVIDGKDNTDKKPDIIIPSDDDHNNKVPAGKDDKGDDNGGTVIINPGDNNNTPGGADNKPSTKPEYVPTKDIKDPELVFDSNKKGNGNQLNPDKGNLIFKDDIVSDVTNDDGTSMVRVVVSVPTNAFYQLFKGGTFSDKYVFYSLETVVMDFSAIDITKTYNFLDDTYGSDGNFMITGVSLDDGNTWITEFPFTVPEDQKIGVKVKYAYRLSKKDKWTEKVMGEGNEWADQYLPVYESRLYVLNQKINEESPVITTDMILNPHDQYNNAGDIFTIYRFQEELFKSNKWIDEDGYNTVLFPDWVEDGNLVDRYYTVTKGRHVFQPIGSVSIPNGLKVKLKSYFLDPYEELEYLQTLTSFDNASMHFLVGRCGSTRTVYVPKYIQSIDLDQDPSSTCAWMEIPDTVVNINDSTAPWYVTNGFIVDENNPYYSSDEEGLLLSKDETEILAIPSSKTSITIEPGIKTVHFSYGSSVKEITVLANSLDEMPELDLSRLSNATIHVQSSVMAEFINENHDVLESSGISVSSIANEDLSYIFDNDLQIGSDNGLYHSFSSAETLLLTNNISSVKSGAFEGTSTATLILPEDGTVIDFASGSLKNSSVKTVICYTKKQEDEVSNYLNQDGLTDVKVILSAMSADGNYQYYAENGVYTLVKAYNSPEIYDGSLILDNGETVYVGEIAGGAFKGNTTLKVVNLNESVKKIGTQAFMNCSNLESFMINSTDVISIGDKAVDGCYNLRFMASNAYEGIMENDYGPQVYNMGGECNFYIPTNATGYNNAIYFTPDSGVFGYEMVDNNLLYGCDMTLQPWLLISASHASGTVNITPGTVEIYRYAFAGLMDEFTIPFEHLDPYNDFVYIDAAAFEFSGITDVTIDKGAFIYDEAFYGCPNLTEFAVNGNVTLEDNVLAGCENLEKVTFGKLFSNSLRPNMFNGCNKLSELNLNGYYDYYDRAPSLMVWDHQKFRFNMEWESEEDEIAHLEINLGEDIDVDDLVSEWRYGFLGYANIYNSSYIDLWEHCKSVLQFTLEDGKPTDEQVDALVEENLLEAENRIRRMVGADQAEEPVPYILYSQLTSKVYDEVTINSITIRGTSGPMESIDLDDRLDLPVLDNVFYDFVIREGAFVNSPNLKAVFLPGSCATVLQDGFLSGVQSESVGIWNISGPIPELEIKEEGVPFSFGIEDERINIICVNDRQSLLDEWQYALIGYSSEETFEEAMLKQLKEEQPELEENSKEFEEALQKKEDEKLQAASDRLDTIFQSFDFDR